MTQIKYVHGDEKKEMIRRNVELGQVRTVVEQTFGQIQGRWRIFSRRADNAMNIEVHALSFAIACAIFNFLCDIGSARKTINYISKLEILWYNALYVCLPLRTECPRLPCSIKK